MLPSVRQAARLRCTDARGWEGGLFLERVDLVSLSKERRAVSRVGNFFRLRNRKYTGMKKISAGPQGVMPPWRRDVRSSNGLTVRAANLHPGWFGWLDPQVNPDAVLELKTALVAATRDPNVRARAIVALRGAEVWGATWPSERTLRTLTNTEQVTALPLFTDERELHEAAVRYGWLTVDGQAPRRLMPLWEAMRAAKQLSAQMMVIDIASDHALELDQGDMELLSAAPSARPGTHTKRRLRSTPPPSDESMEVKRASGRPVDTDGTGGSGHYSPLRPRSVTPSPDTHAVSATFGATPTATMVALHEQPQDDLLDALSDVLRAYPEVEWACLVSSSRADSNQRASVALRIEPAFLKNLAEITRRLREASTQHGMSYDVLVLDTADQMKHARNIGVPFYPWRK